MAELVAVGLLSLCCHMHLRFPTELVWGWEFLVGYLCLSYRHCTERVLVPPHSLRCKGHMALESFLHRVRRCWRCHNFLSKLDESMVAWGGGGNHVLGCEERVSNFLHGNSCLLLGGGVRCWHHADLGSQLHSSGLALRWVIVQLLLTHRPTSGCGMSMFGRARSANAWLRLPPVTGPVDRVYGRVDAASLGMGHLHALLRQGAQVLQSATSLRSLLGPLVARVQSSSTTVLAVHSVPFVRS